MSLLVVGSIALDTVKTPVEEHGDLLGGSASYAAAAASYFSPVNLVGVVGSRTLFLGADHRPDNPVARPAGGDAPGTVEAFEKYGVM